MVDLSDLPMTDSPPQELEELSADRFALNADKDDKAWAGLNRSFFAAVGEAQSVSELAIRVLVILAREGGRYTTTDEGNDSPIVDLKEFALVMRELAKKGYNENTPQLSRKVSEALDTVRLAGQDDVVSEIGIDLPDFEATASNEIVAENVKLMGPVIVAAMMEELKAFQVVDRLVEMAQAGTLPLVGRGNAGQS